jgi:hypothetical protein
MAGVQANAQSVEAHSLVVDLKAGTLNGRPIAEWTLDAITDAVGRPSAVTPGIEGITGSQLQYHPQGVSLWFRPKEKDPAQHLWMATVFVARRWDPDHVEWYRSFVGSMSPAVDANWKQARLESEFAPLHPTIRTVEERKREVSASGVPGLAQSVANDVMSVTVAGTEVRFVLEPSTQFLERVVLTVADPVR